MVSNETIITQLVPTSARDKIYLKRANKLKFL